MTEPNYKPTPSTASKNAFRASNTQRSRVTNSYKGISGSPFDNDLFNLRIDQKPKVLPIYETITDREIELSQDKRKFFSPKQYQTIISNFDLSNLNASYDEITGTYTYNTNDSRYYGNTFARVGLEKVFQITSGMLSMPRVAPCDLSRLFIQIVTTDFNMANYSHDYMFSMYPDSALSTVGRLNYQSDAPTYQLNGYCSLNDIKLSIRDIAGNVIFRDPKMQFAVSGIGATTTLISNDHGLTTGMTLYLENNSNRKDIFRGVYPIVVISPNTIEIPVDTTGLTYLIGALLKVIIDDYVFNYTVKVYSIREDENNATVAAR